MKNGIKEKGEAQAIPLIYLMVDSMTEIATTTSKVKAISFK
jgi:hypothetical protein